MSTQFKNSPVHHAQSHKKRLSLKCCTDDLHLHLQPTHTILEHQPNIDTKNYSRYGQKGIKFRG
jgi:hypothetical protein